MWPLPHLEESRFDVGKGVWVVRFYFLCEVTDIGVCGYMDFIDIVRIVAIDEETPNLA